jgi:hypothetical protein
MQPRSALEAAPGAADNRARYARHLRRETQRQSQQTQLLAERKRAARAQRAE